MVEGKSSASFSASSYSVLLASVVVFGTLVKSQLAVDVSVCFWAFSSFPLIFMSVCWYHTVLITGFVVNLKLGSASLPSLFFKIVLAV